MKPSSAQMRALRSAAVEPLRQDLKGSLRFDGANGARHAWDTVYSAIRHGWLCRVPTGLDKRTDKIALTPTGRALLAEEKRDA